MKTTFHRALSVAAGFFLLPVVPVSAEEDSKTIDPPAKRETLTGDWFGYGPGLREAGLDLRLEWSQFYQGMVDGDKGDPNTWQYGGRLDGLAKVDLSKWGLWDGFSLTGEGNLNYGESVNGFSGTAFPINTALFFPDVNNIGEKEVNRAEVSAFYFTQNFSELVSASAGKSNNATEAIRYRPMFGGGGVDTFWNLNPAVTSSGLVPAATYDAKVNLRTDPVSFSFMLYDPVDAYNKDLFTEMFENGIGVNAGCDAQDLDCRAHRLLRHLRFIQHCREPGFQRCHCPGTDRCGDQQQHFQQDGRVGRRLDDAAISLSGPGQSQERLGHFRSADSFRR